MVALREHAEEPVRAAGGRDLTSPLLETVDVQKVFVAGNRKVEAVAGVSIAVGPNESVGLVGESGSGKTTVARMILGLETPTSGEILIDDVSVKDWARLKRADRKRLRGVVQIVFQDPYSSLNPQRTVGWTLSEAITISDPGAQNVSARVRDLLDSVGLPESYARRKPVALSGGERQRVAIARALAVQPRLIVCDEPVSALDMSVQAQILNLFAKLREERGIAYLFIAHDLAIVRQVVDYIYVMFRGRVVEAGPVEQVLESPQDPYTRNLLASVPRSEPGWLAAEGQS
jgi:peptide/nickel transport system ATP-binding protein